jgi:ribosomal protein L23
MSKILLVSVSEKKKEQVKNAIKEQFGSNFSVKKVSNGSILIRPTAKYSNSFSMKDVRKMAVVLEKVGGLFLVPLFETLAAFSKFEDKTIMQNQILGSFFQIG